MAKQRINPNTADLQSLEELPGIGKTLAVNIVSARPYIELDDLESVKGLGKSRLARIKPYLSFEARDQTPPTENGSKEETDSVKSRTKRRAGTVDGNVIAPASSPAKTTDKSKAAPRANTFSRTATISLVLVMGLVSGLFTVFSAITTFYVLNGSLDFGRAQTIQTMEGLITSVDQDLAVLSTNVEQMNERLSTLEGLGTRMDTVEGEVQGLGTEIGTALESVDAMQENLDQLALETAALSEDVGRFEQFADGLRSLLSDLFQ